MKKIVFFTILALLCAPSLFAQIGYKDITPITFNKDRQAPLHEVRAVWLTTIGGLDWPHSYAQSSASIEKQKNELRSILDKLQHAGINLVFLQTRVRATTIFPSTKEPWDGCLSGKPGTSPGYDALAFAIDECHKRGMQLHAWVVTIPVGKWNATGCKNLRKTVPSLLKKIGDEGFMNPEQSGTSTYLASFCGDLAKRYDIDGIHLDYIRYPETWGKIKNRDAGRKNITRIVEAIHNSVKKEKPWIMMSCSPIGKYADLPRQWSHGWNARDIVCQDAAEWMKSGLMDALFPMMYFKGENFYPFAIDWHERSAGRIVAPGLGIYFLSPKEKNWALTDITRELQVLRQYGMGHTYFRSKFFTDNTKGLYDYVTEEYCPYPALIPAMSWYGFKRPDAPQSISHKTTSSTTQQLEWTEGKDHSDGPYLTYNVYASNDFPVDCSNARNILFAYKRGNSLTVPQGMYYAVTSVDRYGNESTPRQMFSTEEYEQKKAKEFKASPYCPIIVCSNSLKLNQINKIFTISSSKDIIGIETLEGNIIKTFTPAESIDISSIPAGMYTVRSFRKKGIPHRLCFLKVMHNA